MTVAINPDDFDRVAKLLVDAGDVADFDQALELLRTYRFQIVADARHCRSPAWQAAMLTAVNAGRRAMHGGVSVKLAEDTQWTHPVGVGETLARVLANAGATIVTTLQPGVPTIALADAAINGEAVYPSAGVWIAGVGTSPLVRTSEASVVAAILAATIAVSECFQRLRGFPVAGDREAGVSLWNPDLAWTGPGAEGPPLASLPAEAWLLGLGHLGQALAWVLALLPYGDDPRKLVLQDDDRLSRANRATSMLEVEHALGRPKARLVADAAERAGWVTSIIERRYRGGLLREPQDPVLLIAGLDNPEARRMLDDTGFPVIYDAGLGAGPDGYLEMAVRRLPAQRSSAEIWESAGGDLAPTLLASDAYRILHERTGDTCGVEQLAGRTVATAFVGVTAACWTIGSALREMHGGARYDLVDYSLRDPGRVVVLPAEGGGRLRLTGVPVRTVA